MIKLLHFADLHLGVENYGRLDPQTGLSTRLGDFLRSLDLVVDHALSQDVDLVVFCGDAYHSVHPSPTNQREFARRIRRLSEAEIPVLLLIGNHDLPLAAGKAASTEIFSTLDVPNVVVATTVESHLIETKSGAVQVVAVPWPVRSHLQAKAQFRGKTTDEVNEELAEAVTGLVRREIEGLDPDLPIVLAAHVTVFGAETSYGGQASVFLGRDVIFPNSLLADRAFDYVALGHIHKHQVVREANPPVAYSGSIERIDFGEEKEEKGFILVELEKGRTGFRFVPLPVRDFLTIEVKADGPDPTAQVLEAIANHDLDEKVVRLIVRTSAEKEPLLNEAEVFAALSSAFHVAALIKDVERPVRLRIGERNYEEMTTREILETYLKVKQVPRQRAQVLLRYAEQLSQDLD
ncbi:MAG: exonuclease SbcCD subunit D [Anaerolineae bacterium]